MFDNRLHEVFAKDENFHPTRDSMRCTTCGSRLMVFDAGAKLYAVKCRKCQKVLLVNGENPSEAAAHMGIPAEKIRIPGSYKYEILIYNVYGQPGLECAMRTKKYPSWQDMMEMCRHNNIQGVHDFKDINNALSDDVRVIYGFGFGAKSRRRVLEYQITKLTDRPTMLEELLVKGEKTYEFDD